MRYKAECEHLARLVLTDVQEGDTYLSAILVRGHTHCLTADIHEAITKYMEWLLANTPASPAARRATRQIQNGMAQDVSE